MTIQAAPARHEHAGVVFVDPWHAMIAVSGTNAPEVRTMVRGPESQLEFLGRVAHQTSDCDRLVVMGPGVDRLAFEREYVTVFQRPDRLVQDEPIVAATRFDLLDRLRVLDS